MLIDSPPPPAQISRAPLNELGITNEIIRETQAFTWSLISQIGRIERGCENFSVGLTKMGSSSGKFRMWLRKYHKVDEKIQNFPLHVNRKK